MDLRKGEICFDANFQPSDFNSPAPEKEVSKMIYSIDQSAKRTRINSANATGKTRLKSAVHRNVNRQSDATLGSGIILRTQEGILSRKDSSVSAVSGFGRTLTRKVKDMEVASFNSPEKAGKAFNATSYKQALKSSDLKIRPTTAGAYSRFAKTSVFQSTDFIKDRKLPAQISKNGLSTAISKHE